MKRRIFFFFFTSCSVLFIVHCMNGKTEIYSYSDGSNNTYIIQENVLEYKPVKPAFSSSGDYDGGEYVKKEISESEYRNIISLLEEAILDKSMHIKNRIMTSGFIKVEKNNRIIKVIIKPDSDIKLRIEEALKNIILK